MVFCFTATGNSLYVARRLDDNVISIPQVLRGNNFFFEDEAIGIVAPIYGSEMPYMVQEFLKRAHLKTDYFYIILTYGCSSGAASSLMEKLVQNCSIHVDYFHTVLMVDNFLPGFDMNREKSVEKHIEQQILAVKKDIEERKKEIQRDSETDLALYDNVMRVSAEHPELSWKNIIFRTSDACTGCGLCTRLCPAGCISMVNGKALHKDDGCQKCMACIHGCPANAVTMSVPEQNSHARFRNEHIALNEIAIFNSGR